MPDQSITDRIRRIQRHLNLEPDGIIGADTLTGIENRLFNTNEVNAGPYSLVVSRTGVEQLIAHEVVSGNYYNRKLKRPVWPGGASGVTIGIGYDLGYNRDYQIRDDWGGRVPDAALELLVECAGLKADKAHAALDKVKTIEITFESASEVFSRSTLPRYAEATLKAYPGTDKLFHDAQSALLSLVYNRGTSMSGARRREMAAIKPLVVQQDYNAIAQEIIGMKRLWINKGLDGLLKRRDAEAWLVQNADRTYSEAELVRV